MRFILIGFGKFGRLSFDRLRSTFVDAEFIIVDPSIEQNSVISDAKIRPIPAGGVEILLNYDQLSETDLIVPVAPLNIAGAYIWAYYSGSEYSSLPVGLADHFKNLWLIDHATLCVSNANFICPDDCPEGDTCTITGERRMPMYEKIECLKFPGFEIRVIRSFQLAPGVGGYTLGSLISIRDSVASGQKYVIATSCKCHAILSAIRVGLKN
ncbi:MAG: hypothetical protein ACLPVO_13435 [Desulfomonilaceae bacterium]